MLHIIY